MTGKLSYQLDFLQLVDKVPALIAVYRIDSGQYSFVGKAAETILGYKPEQLLEGGVEFVTSRTHPDDLPAILEKNQAILSEANKNPPSSLQKEPVVSFEYRVKHNNGRWVWLHSDGSVFSRNSRGKIEQVLNVSIDITERKRAEDNLKHVSSKLEQQVKRRTERLGLALEASKMGTWEWDVATGQLTWSDRLYRLFGLNPKATNITYERYMNLLYPDDALIMRGTINKAMKHGKGYVVEHRCIWPDGSVHWLQGRGKAFLKNGKPERMIGTTVNIDERVELVALNNAKDEFISLASHQLRTPATGVKQYLDLLADGYAGQLTPVQLDMLKTAYKSNDRELHIIDDLLKVANLDAGKVGLRLEKADLVALCKNVISELQANFKRHGQPLNFSHSQNRVYALVDRYLLRMVIENILDNAGKYSYDKQVVSIQLRKSGGKITITIKDRGVGIPKSELGKLFQKFSRIDNPLSRQVGGSGLGLYWAKKVVDMHGGNIEVVSSPGKGTSFKVSLPA